MLVWGTCQPVVQVFEMQGGKVAVAVEGVEMRAEGGLVPDALGWDARSALLGWRFYGYDVEAVSHALEGFVGEDGLCSLLRIFQEDRHFCIGIAFSHVCDVDASVGVGSLLQGDVWCRLVAFLMNQNVFRRYLVGERGGYLAAVVAQVEGDVYGIFRHRNEEYVLETLRVLLCLWIGEPFLEEGGEGVAVDDFARAVVAYGYLSVALYREFGQSLPFAVPAWHYVEFVYGYHLLLLVAGKGIVYPQRLVCEIVVKVLRLYCAGRHQHRHGSEG